MCIFSSLDTKFTNRPTIKFHLQFAHNNSQFFLAPGRLSNNILYMIYVQYYTFPYTPFR